MFTYIKFLDVFYFISNEVLAMVLAIITVVILITILIIHELLD